MAAQQIRRTQMQNGFNRERMTGKPRPELDSSRNYMSDKARTGLQVMNGLFVLFCGLYFSVPLLHHRRLWRVTNRLVRLDCAQLWFYRCLRVGVLGGRKSKTRHEAQTRQVVKHCRCRGLALLTLLASVIAGSIIAGLIGGIGLGAPAAQ